MTLVEKLTEAAMTDIAPMLRDGVGASTQVYQWTYDIIKDALLAVEQAHKRIWTSEKPTKPGWYWWRLHSKKSPLVVNVYTLSNVWCCSFPDDEPCPLTAAKSEWAGPIPEPKEPR